MISFTGIFQGFFSVFQEYEFLETTGCFRSKNFVKPVEYNSESSESYKLMKLLL